MTRVLTPACMREADLPTSTVSDHRHRKHDPHIHIITFAVVRETTDVHLSLHSVAPLCLLRADPITLSNLLDRSEADARGIKKA